MYRRVTSRRLRQASFYAWRRRADAHAAAWVLAGRVREGLVAIRRVIRPWFAFTVAVRAASRARGGDERARAREKLAVAATALAAFRCNARRWRWLTVATEGVRNHRVFVARSNAFGAWAKLARDTSTSLLRHAGGCGRRPRRASDCRRVVPTRRHRSNSSVPSPNDDSWRCAGTRRLARGVSWSEPWWEIVVRRRRTRARSRFAVDDQRCRVACGLVVRRWRERVLAARAFHATFRRAAARTPPCTSRDTFSRGASPARPSSPAATKSSARRKKNASPRREDARVARGPPPSPTPRATRTPPTAPCDTPFVVFSAAFVSGSRRGVRSRTTRRSRANVARAKERMAVAAARRRIAALASRCFRAWWREGVVTRRARDAFRERTRDRRLRALVRDWRVAARLGPRTRGAERDAAKRAARRADVVETRNSARILRAWRRETTRKTRGRDVSRRAAERRVTARRDARASRMARRRARTPPTSANARAEFRAAPRIRDDETTSPRRVRGMEGYVSGCVSDCVSGCVSGCVSSRVARASRVASTRRRMASNRRGVGGEERRTRVATSRRRFARGVPPRDATRTRDETRRRANVASRRVSSRLRVDAPRRRCARGFAGAHSIASGVVAGCGSRRGE